MEQKITTIIAIITLLIMLGGFIFTAGSMWAKINENAASIAERKMSGKTVRENTNRIVQIETEQVHNKSIHKYSINTDNKQDEEIGNVKARLRRIENKVLK